MNDLIIKQDISKMIYNLNDVKIILDEDLASLMNIETKVLNQTVKRNIVKFYEEDYFKLTLEEYKELKNVTFNSNFVTFNSNFATSSLEKKVGRKYTPYAFARDAIITLLELKIGRENSEILEEVIDLLEDEKSEYELLESPVITGENVKNIIYEIRGKQVMLDSDLAFLYQVKNGTKEINQAVKNNIEKFPERFCFRITEEEFLSLKSKILTSKGGSRKGHTVFTEQGTLMLATVLKSDVATRITIAIMDAFIEMRKYITYNSVLQEQISNSIMNKVDQKFGVVDNRIQLLEKSFDELKNGKTINEVYFNGKIYDAYSALMKIFKTSKNELIIEDSYADSSVLDIIRELKVPVIIITKPNGLLSLTAINKYKSQYNNLKVAFSKRFHDRFIIVDRKEVYHCGASINHAGRTAFAINRINDSKNIQSIMSDIINVIEKS